MIARRSTTATTMWFTLFRSIAGYVSTHYGVTPRFSLGQDEDSLLSALRVRRSHRECRKILGDALIGTMAIGRNRDWRSRNGIAFARPYVLAVKWCTVWSCISRKLPCRFGSWANCATSLRENSSLESSRAFYLSQSEFRDTRKYRECIGVSGFGAVRLACVMARDDNEPLSRDAIRVRRSRLSGVTEFGHVCSVSISVGNWESRGRPVNFGTLNNTKQYGILFAQF